MPPSLGEVRRPPYLGPGGGIEVWSESSSRRGRPETPTSSETVRCPVPQTEREVGRLVVNLVEINFCCLITLYGG